MSKTNNPKPDQAIESLICPIRYLNSVFGGKWKLLIVCILAGDAPVRYSAIKRRLGDITNVMLSQSLKDLESSGIVYREQFNEVPPRVEYSLTDKGRLVEPMLAQLVNWAEETVKAEEGSRTLCGKCQAIN